MSGEHGFVGAFGIGDIVDPRRTHLHAWRGHFDLGGKWHPANDDQLAALRAALGIPAEATHDEAVERARRIAYEAETARLIEGIYADVQQWGDGVWQVDTESNGSHLNGNLHLAVRAAAGKEVQS